MRLEVTFRIFERWHDLTFNRIILERWRQQGRRTFGTFLNLPVTTDGETRMKTKNPGTTFSSKLGDKVSSQKRHGQKHISKSHKTCMVSASLCHGIKQANLRRSFCRQVTVGPEVRSRGWSTTVPLNFWNCPLQAPFLDTVLFEEKLLGVYSKYNKIGQKRCRKKQKVMKMTRIWENVTHISDWQKYINYILYNLYIY